jgi:hypothetical protein
MSRASLIRDLGLLADWFGVNLTETRMVGYCERFARKNIDEQRVRVAIERAKDACRFFPSFAELLDLAGASTAQDGEKAWNALMCYEGALKDMPLYGKTLAIVKAMGGRGSTPTSFRCWSPGQEEPKRKEFLRRWKDEENPSGSPQLETSAASTQGLGEAWRL